MAAAILALGCGAGSGAGQSGPLRIGAIPDQDPQLLQRLYHKLSDYLARELNVTVEHAPVTDYAAAVTAFRVGDLDLVWFGGLTGVQARLQVPGAQALVQRAIDQEFHSVFIASTSSGLEPIQEPVGLRQLRKRSFTFGSESSTSGRLMPQYFLQQAGVTLDDFRGAPGFSGSHDKTIKLVEAGTYEAGVVNEQVWRSRVAGGAVDTTRVRVIWRTPPYYDYHWVIRADVADRFGADFIERVRGAFLRLDPSDPGHQEILDLFGAERFVATRNENYAQIEEIGRAIGKIR